MIFHIYQERWECFHIENLSLTGVGMLAANLRISTHWPGISFDKNSLPKSQPTPFRFPPLSQAKMIGIHHQNVISSLFFPTKIKGSTHTSTNLPGEVLLLGAGKSTLKKPLQLVSLVLLVGFSVGKNHRKHLETSCSWRKFGAKVEVETAGNFAGCLLLELQPIQTQPQLLGIVASHRSVWKAVQNVAKHNGSNIIQAWFQHASTSNKSMLWKHSLYLISSIWSKKMWLGLWLKASPT